jgi:5-methylcytosine-specific restriction endonuclease McrA
MFVEFDVQKEIRETFAKARLALRREKRLATDNTLLIGWLYQLNAAVNLNMSEREFLSELGLTRDQYYNRAMAARVLRLFPDYRKAYEAGEVGLSVLALVQSKISEANSRVILENIRGKSKREARCFLAKVDRNGRVYDHEASLEITFTLKESDLEKLEEARSVLSARGRVPTNGELLAVALDDLLERRDPVRRAKRAEARAKKKAEAVEAAVGASFRDDKDEQGDDRCPSFRNDESSNAPEPSSGPSFRNDETKPRTAIPQAVVHKVWRRDGRQCTYRYPDGSRCSSTLMLELDHLVPWARGGQHSVGNLRVVCRAHNQSLAEQAYGRTHMAQYRCRSETASQIESFWTLL